MIIECEKCHTKFNLDENLLKETGSKVRCSICKHVFTAFPPKEELEVEGFKTEKIESPVNVGSGKGTTLFDLAERIKSLTNSKSEIKVEQARSAEVVKFTASTERMLQTFDINLPDDPLYFLPNLLQENRFNKRERDSSNLREK